MSICIFCDIINKKIPCYEIYKNDFVTAFLDINPIASGHTLIIPNKQIERLDYIDEPIISNELMNSLIEVSKVLINSGICEDYTVITDNGDSAQQDIKHVHFHIIPRRKDEKFRINLDTDPVAAERTSLFKTWEIIKSEIGNQ